MNLAALFWRRKGLILGVTGTAILVAFLVTLGIPETYRATATVLITPPGYQAEIAAKPATAETYREIATTPVVVLGALERAGLGGPNPPTGWSPEMAARRLRVETHEERGLYNTVLVSPLMGLSVTDTDPERARAVANGWAEALQEVSQQFKGQGSRRLAVVLEGQSSAAAERLTWAEGALRDYRQDAALQILTQEARAQAESLATARGARLAAEQELESTAAVLETLRATLQAEGGALASPMDGATGSLARSAQAVRAYRQTQKVSAIEEELATVRNRLAARRAEVTRLDARLHQAAAEVVQIAPVLAEATETDPVERARAAQIERTTDGPPLMDLLLLDCLQGSALEALRDRYYQARVDSEALEPLLQGYRSEVKELQNRSLELEKQVLAHRDALALLEEHRSQALQRVTDLGALDRTLHDDVAKLTLSVVRLQARIEALNLRETDLRKAAAELDARLVEAQLRDAHLEAELNRNRSLDNTIAARAQEARSVEIGDASDVTLVSLAALPERPVSPRLFLNLLAAGLFGLAASAALLALTAVPGAPR